MDNNTIEFVGELSHRATVVTGVSTGIWGLVTSNFFMGLAGILLAAITTYITWYYKREDNNRNARKREEEASLSAAQVALAAAQAAEIEHRRVFRELQIDYMKRTGRVISEYPEGQEDT